jgi:iron complex transport system substrate-binding protein
MRFLLFTAIFLSVFASFAAKPVNVTDSRGKVITINKVPQRIISMAPNVTEILFEIGAGKRVIADTLFCDYPPQAVKLPKIGDYLTPNVEKISSLKPDLIIASRGNNLDAIKQMEKSGMKVVTVDAVDIPTTLHDIIVIGDAVGCPAQAKKTVDKMKAEIKYVETAVAKIPENKRLKVLFLFPPYDSLFTAGTGSHIDNMITRAGGKNIAAKTNKPWPQLSLEMVVSANPDVIITTFAMGRMKSNTPKELIAQMRADKRWKNINAVKNGRVYILDEDMTTLPGPRLSKGLWLIAYSLYPKNIKFPYWNK